MKKCMYLTFAAFLVFVIGVGLLSINTFAMSDTLISSTVTLEDDPATPFVEQEVQEILCEHFENSMDEDVYWNSAANDFCKYTCKIEYHDDFLTIYISCRPQVPEIEDDDLVIHGPLVFDSRFDEFVYWTKWYCNEAIEQFMVLLDENPEAILVILLLIILTVELVIGFVLIIKFLIKKMLKLKCNKKQK